VTICFRMKLKKAAKVLLEMSKEEINAPTDRKGRTMLLRAIDENRLDVVKMLCTIPGVDFGKKD